MPPKKSQQKQNASSKPSKKVKTSGAKAKAVDDPLMVFEFESEDEEEVVVTPLRPRGAVPTPKQLSGQSSDGNDPLTDDRLSSAEGNGGDDTEEEEEEEEEEAYSEPEDVLVGIAQEPSPAAAAALGRKRAGVKPRGGMTRGGWNKRVKSDDVTIAASATSPRSSATSRENAAGRPVISDPLVTPPSKAHVPGKRGRKPGAAKTKMPPHVTNTPPHVINPSPQSGEVKRKRGRPKKNPNPPSSPPPPKPSQPVLQRSPFSSSSTALVALEAALIDTHPLCESPVQVEVHDSAGGIVAPDNGAPVPTEVAPRQPEPVMVVKRKRGRPRKTPLPPPPVVMETPFSEESRGVVSSLPGGVVSDDVSAPWGALQGPISDTESPLAGFSSCKVNTPADEPSVGETSMGVSSEHTPMEEVLVKATPTGEEPGKATPTEDSLQYKHRQELELRPIDASGVETTPTSGTGTESCDTSAGHGDSTPDHGVKISGDLQVEEAMEEKCNGGVSSVHASNVRQCCVREAPPPAGEDSEEKHGDTTTEEEQEEEEEEAKVEEPPRPSRFTRPGVKAITSFSVGKSADVPVPAITRASTWPARRESADTEKGVPTVVRNVKQAHECQLLGESQQHIDELYFLLDSIGSAQSPCIRAMATCSLAQQCLGNEFRHIIKEKKLLSKMFARLKDGTGDPGIRLAIAVLAYVLSRDRSNHNWSSDVADLLISVMSLERKEVDGEEVISLGKDSKDYLRVLNKARKVVECACSVEASEVKGEEGKVQKPGDCYKINEQHISVPELVCEVFLTISAPNNSCQWLREQLRASGGLDLIANMVITGCNFVEHSLKGLTGEEDVVVVSRRLNEMERQLKCLENATFMNKTNQSYLVVFDGSLLVSKLTKLLLACERMMDKAELRRVAQECLVSVTKLLLNLTNDNELGSCRLGEQAGLLGAVLHIVFKLPCYIPSEEHFDILVLGLGLLINLTELSAPNRHQLQTLAITPHQSAAPSPDEGHLPPRGYPFLGPLAELFLKHHSKVEKATIDVPTPQRLSQLTSQESPGSSKGGQGQNQQTTTFSERLKLLKMAKKTPKAEMRELAGTDLEEGQEREDKEESEGSVQIDPLVFSREDFDNALSQAGRHMEDSILAAYAALLLGILAKHHHDCVDHVKNEMPSKTFAEMLEDLHRFVSFMSMTGAHSGLESVRHIIKYLEVM